MRITSTNLLSQALRQARLDRGLTQTDVAQLVGMKQSTVSAIENHPDQARLKTLFRILSALELELELNERSNAPRDSAEWSEEW
ncbi:helix-turn-helix domain-containing protein [Guyparkeria sp. SCN-R1]|uniref:helix-turn-helix domain-containing protein n=1 Tax=Guyparkeria sp. SCN-R1 TaxID=2341113 RepID=UPI000F64AE21|nr:helix-turn-helix domain-containing protein [Guyparkeria sp. SCN-R1]RRQ20339.1 helix-turn-helix domain-containing protein [Guyparkeria sp. SCN-R1]